MRLPARLWGAVSLASSAVAVVVSPRGSNLTLRVYKEALRDQLVRDKPPGFLPSDPQVKEKPAPRCNVTDAEACAISSLPAGVDTLVHPYGRSRCIGPGPYGFHVVPGDRTKLYIHFQQGGGCWDEITSDFCYRFIDRYSTKGFWSACPPPGVKSPFQDFTIVSLGYCSGDLFVGDTGTLAGKPFERRGYWNARETWAWIDKNLGTSFKTIVISGSSGGTLGAILWSHWLLKHYEHEDAHVVTDSYVGVFPEGFVGRSFKGFGACAWTDVFEGIPGFVEKCNQAKLTAPDLLYPTLKMQSGKITFGALTSKFDSYQTFMWEMASQSVMAWKAQEYCNGDDSCDLSGAPTEVTEPIPKLSLTDFYTKAQDLFHIFKGSGYDNYNWYLLTSDYHLISDITYGTCSDVLNWPGAPSIKRLEPVRAWMDLILAGRHSRQCEAGPWPGTPQAVVGLDNTCRAALESEVIRSSGAGASVGAMALLVSSLIVLSSFAPQP